MSPELAYFLKVNIAIALFYAFYRLFFYEDTFFKWRRTALLCFLAISMLYPLLNIQEWVKELRPMAAMADIYSTIILPEITIDASRDINWKQLLVSSFNCLYTGMLGFLFIRFLVQLFGIIRLGIQTPATILKGTRFHLLNKPQGSFSFFKWIFMYPQIYTEEELEEILIHEKTHACQWHSVDVILSELICIFCWFNPFVWLLKREIRRNLEFIADHKVLETGHDCKTYQYHLLELTYEKEVATLYNKFNVLPLKIRIRMMNKKRTKRIERTKYLLLLPLTALLLIVSNIETIARSTEKIINPATETDPIVMNDFQPQSLETLLQERSSDMPADTTVFEVVEQMPQYPGGTKALMNFLAYNIRYPKDAAKNKVQGRVVVQFVVDKEGNVINPKITRSVNHELDGEALRVVRAMPKWTPGVQRGKKVSVRYTIPIAFSIPPGDAK
ncbi:MAG: TonB family protein [Mediterranea sp.]|jgi:TonB family protein|nr:TonB family protein [Mediterranea sp.]